VKMKTRVKKHSLKFLSVFLSIFLWVYVLNSEKVKFEKTVSLEYILPVDMMFAQRPPQEVVFLIEGPRAFVRTVAEREDRIVIDLNRANARRSLDFTVDINPAQLNLPFGMVVERVIPRKLQIRLEKKASKIVPLKLQFAGQLPERLALQNPELEPAEVEVYGPRSLIAKLKELPIRPVELEGLPGLDQVPVEVQLPDDRLTVTGGFDVKLRFQLKASSSNFTVTGVPIRFLSEKRKLAANVRAADVKLLVPERLLKNRSNISSTVQVWADVPDHTKGRITVPLKVILPPTIHLLEISPKSIIVNIQ
jgi:YbbR domain-containing protein